MRSRALIGASLTAVLAIPVFTLAWGATRHVGPPTTSAEQISAVQLALPPEVIGAASGAGPSAAPASPVASRRPPLLGDAPVAPLKKRVDPDVFIRTPQPVTTKQLAELLAKTGGKATLVATGGVSLGAAASTNNSSPDGVTTAIGVDPSTFRAFAPKGTAESTPLWQAVARGDVAVAHTVARALAVQLGQDAAVTAKTGAPGTDWDFRVGAYATTGLPGIGVVIDARYDSLLGLVPRTGVVLTAEGIDPAVTAAVAQEVLGTSTGGTVTATPLRVSTGPGGHIQWVPPAAGPITAGYGYGLNPQGGKPGFHPGIDIGAPFGAPIYAAAAGVVSYAGPAQGFGNEVAISHANGVQTVYGHMERILVAAGQSVRVGQPIALVGSEGESTGPHLHFEVHLGDATIDPLPWLISHGVTAVK